MSFPAGRACREERGSGTVDPVLLMVGAMPLGLACGGGIRGLCCQGRVDQEAHKAALLHLHSMRTPPHAHAQRLAHRRGVSIFDNCKFV